MFFKVIGTILLGGGMLGAASGWLLIRWLERRYHAGLERAKQIKENHAMGVSVSHSSPGLIAGLRQMQRELSAPPTQPPPKPPEPIQMWTPTADPNARRAEPTPPPDPLADMIRRRQQAKMEAALARLEEYLRQPPEEKK